MGSRFPKQTGRSYWPGLGKRAYPKVAVTFAACSRIAYHDCNIRSLSFARCVRHNDTMTFLVLLARCICRKTGTHSLQTRGYFILLRRATAEPTKRRIYVPWNFLAQGNNSQPFPFATLYFVVSRTVSLCAVFRIHFRPNHPRWCWWNFVNTLTINGSRLDWYLETRYLHLKRENKAPGWSQ